MTPPHRAGVFATSALEVGTELADGGNRYHVVRVEQPPSPRGFGRAWAELVER